MQKKKLRFTIQAKSIIFIYVLVILLVEVAMAYFSLVSSSSNRQQYKDIASSLAGTVAATVDTQKAHDLIEEVKLIYENSETKPRNDEWGSDAWNAYVEQFTTLEESQNYKDLINFLQKVERANSHEIDCIYITFVDIENENCIYVADGDLVDPCPIGSIDEMNEDAKAAIRQDPANGFPASIVDYADFGQLVTAGKPIYHNDEVIGYMATDISLKVIRAHQAGNIIQLFIYTMSTALVVSVFALIISQFGIIKPLKGLTKIASSYDSSNLEKTRKEFSKINTTVNDEIGDLGRSLVKMEEDVSNKIDELTKTNEQLIQSQQENVRITVLANSDALTGLYNKIAYTSDENLINDQIKEGKMQHFGIAMIDLNYLKMINDDFGHVEGDQALIRLGKLIQKTFVHSPAYRIGGDEFVVILKEKDYENAEALIQNFNDEVSSPLNNDESQLTKTVSAALGYAPFDPSQDTCVEDVFKRADNLMYSQKKNMKKQSS